MKFATSFMVLLCVVATVGRSAAASDEGTKVAGRVREIFEAKCLDCHGPELPRPKGKFGYVLDLKRIADNPEYVERGNPEKSEIYKMVFNDDMPGEDANVPPLTAEEKEIVKRWIELNAPPAPATAERTVPTPVVEEAKVERPLWQRLVRWLGQFHPVTTHFPVALMMVAVLAEALAWWTRRQSWLETVRFLVIVAALGAVSAGVLGWFNAYFSSYNKATGALLWWHRWLGTGTSVWVLICAGLLIIHKCEEGSKERQQFRGALLLGAALVSISGFLGSALIYGLDHYAWK
ncbi:MAG: DUF2231 domain-containing protein [Chthoniobacteraceae bacterium]